MSQFQEGRFYEAELPEVDDLVVVQVKRLTEMGAYVSLLEYNGKEGLILSSEVSKRRIRSMTKLLRVGRTEVCMVLRVDQDKGQDKCYIDVSKRRVAHEDIGSTQERFAKAKAVHGIMRHVASMNQIDVEDLCLKVCWPLNKRYESAFDAFRMHVNEEISLWDEVDFSQPGEDFTAIADKLKEDLDLNLRRRLIQQMLRIGAKVEVSCSEYEGIDAIKESLIEGMKASKEDCEVKIRLIAHPLFVISSMCRDRELGMRTVEEAMSLTETKIKALGGSFEVRARPEVVGPDDKNEEAGEEADSESDKGSDSTEAEGEQDVTMGAANFDEEEFAKQTQNMISKDDEDEEVDKDKR